MKSSVIGASSARATNRADDAPQRRNSPVHVWHSRPAAAADPLPHPPSVLVDPRPHRHPAMYVTPGPAAPIVRSAGWNLSAGAEGIAEVRTVCSHPARARGMAIHSGEIRRGQIWRVTSKVRRFTLLPTISAAWCDDRRCASPGWHSESGDPGAADHAGVAREYPGTKSLGLHVYSGTMPTAPAAMERVVRPRGWLRPGSTQRSRRGPKLLRTLGVRRRTSKSASAC